MQDKIKQELSVLMDTDATVRKLLLNATTDYEASLEAAVVELARKLRQTQMWLEIKQHQLSEMSAQLHIERGL